MTTLDEEWNNYLCDSNYLLDNIKENNIEKDQPIPECEELYISTKTKVLFLNQPIL